jgi:hypothetical protein
MSSFYYFLYITNALLLSFILSSNYLSCAIKCDKPKGSLSLTYFISASLIVYSVCASMFKESHFMNPHYTLLVTTHSTKVSCVFKQFHWS